MCRGHDMSKFIDLIGQKFGRLTVITSNGSIPPGKRTWLCKCDCGKETVVATSELRSGKTKSCGCLQKEKAALIGKKYHTIHGMDGTRIYQCWKDMKRRCYNPKTKSFKNYGGRGILVCNDWLHNFQAFHEWAMANGYRDNLTIDRIDVNGNYEPSNCQWIPLSEQPKNRRKPVGGV